MRREKTGKNAIVIVTAPRPTHSFKRFLAGYFIFVATSLSLIALVSLSSFVPIPLQATISVDIVNTSNEAAHEVVIHFYVKDYGNASRIGFQNISYTPAQVPTETWVGPIEDGSGFTLFVPEWHSSEHVRFSVRNVSIATNFPTNLSSLGHRPFDYSISNKSLTFDFSGVLTVAGRTPFGTQSVASLHQFTFNGVTQSVEKRIQTVEYCKGFFISLHFLVFLMPCYLWLPKTANRLPFATLLLALLMIFLYAFVGTGQEIWVMHPYPWNPLRIWPFGILMHAYDSHIFGNLAIFIPLSLLSEVWLKVRDNRQRFFTWYVLPVLVVMVLSRGIGFSVANEWLAWGLWSLIIVDHKTRTKLDLLLCLLSGLMAKIFFGWVIAYLPYIFSEMASTWWGHLAQGHIAFGAGGVVLFTVITLATLRARGPSDFREEGIEKEDKEALDEKTDNGIVDTGRIFLNHFNRSMTIHATIVVAVVFGLISLLGIASNRSLDALQEFLLSAIYWALGAFGHYEISRYRDFGRRAENLASHLAKRMAKRLPKDIRELIEDPQGGKSVAVDWFGRFLFREPLVHVFFFLFLFFAFLSIYTHFWAIVFGLIGLISLIVGVAIIEVKRENAENPSLTCQEREVS